MVACNAVIGGVRLTIVDAISPAFSVQAKVDLHEVASWEAPRPKCTMCFLKVVVAYDKIILLRKFVKKSTVSIKLIVVREFTFKSRVEVTKNQLHVMVE